MSSESYWSRWSASHPRASRIWSDGDKSANVALIAYALATINTRAFDQLGGVGADIPVVAQNDEETLERDFTDPLSNLPQVIIRTTTRRRTMVLILKLIN